MDCITNETALCTRHKCWVKTKDMFVLHSCIANCSGSNSPCTHSRSTRRSIHSELALVHCKIDLHQKTG
jgi:hypothetical protein